MMTTPRTAPCRSLLTASLFVGFVCGIGCAGLERDNPFDADTSIESEVAPEATLTVAVPLPKALATVVDSLVAHLEVPDAPTVIKELTYDTPLGPALLTIGALSPGGGITLTIEGYDLGGRLILAGTQTDITIAANDTTRVSIDLRLTVDLDEIDGPDTGADAGDGGDDTGADPGDGTGSDTGSDTGDGGADPGDTGDSGDTGADPGTDTGDGTGSDTGDGTDAGDTGSDVGDAGDGTDTGDIGSDTGDAGDGSSG
jgi:hypothetical protein